MKPRPLKPLSGRPPRTSMHDFIATLPQPSQALGLTHVTSGYVLRDIIDDNAMTAKETCPVIGEQVIYLFYGRPSYRSQKGNSVTTLAFQCPVVLVIDPLIPVSPKYAFGFDSGAFSSHMMDDFLDPYMPLFDFCIPPTVTAAATLSLAFFGSAGDFLKCRNVQDVHVDHSNFEASSYKAILNSSAGAGLDDRGSTPELLYSDPISLIPWVKAVVLPDCLAADPECGGRLQTFGIDLVEYEWNGRCRPNEYHVLIRRLVSDIYRGLKWL